MNGDNRRMYDLIIRGGSYPDFDKRELVRADIAVSGGRIAAVGDIADGDAAEVIDASGRIVSPGFIDMHMHEEEFGQGGIKLDVSEYLTRQGVTTGVSGNCGQQFHRISEFRKIIDDIGGSYINYAMLAGYNYFRENEGIGWYDDAPEETRARIIDLLREELEAGARGFSFGLEYCPGVSTEEMTGAVMALREYDPFISIHFRADCDDCIDSVREMAELSRATGCRVEISHIGSLAAVGGHMKESLDIIREERLTNPRLCYDVYPYNAFCTIIGSAAFDMDWRAKWNMDYDIIMPLFEPYIGVRCDEALYEKIRREQPDAFVAAFALDENEVRMAIADPMGLFGSDAEVAYGYDIHPRVAGCFPRILGRYVREEGVISLIDALDKMTRRAAACIGLPSKGEIRPGMDADLTIFDPDTIIDGATYTDTSIPNKGIDRVMIGGRTVCAGGELTGDKPGRVL